MTWNVEAPPSAQNWFVKPNLEERGYCRMEQRYGMTQIRHDPAHYLGFDSTLYKVGDPSPSPEIHGWQPTKGGFQMQFSCCILDIPHFDPNHTRYNHIRPYTRFENYHLLPRPEQRTRIIFTSSLIRRFIAVLTPITFGRLPPGYNNNANESNSSDGNVFAVKERLQDRSEWWENEKKWKRS